MDPRDDPPQRRKLRNALLGACAVGVPVTLAVDWQLVWQPLLPIPLLLATPRVVARVMAASAFVLLLLGGAVTTYRVGMAVPDWPATYARNMWTYPLSEMLEAGWGVTLEHSHRLWASAVGLMAICMVLVCWIRRAPRALTAASAGTLVAIVGQGVLGGTRVLEDSTRLAFLHGALAQVVYAMIAALVVLSSRSWRAGGARAFARTHGLRRLALLAVGVVYVQIVLGAMTRHWGHPHVLGAHALFAVAAFLVVLALATRLGQAGDARPLRITRRLLVGALHVQVLLGVGATAAIFLWSGGFDATVSVGEAITATAHVAVGALLLSACVAAGLWSRRLLVAGGTA